MKIVSWNCRANFCVDKANEIVTRYSDADILIIQECQKDWEKERILDNKISRGRWYGDIQNNRNEGVGVFILNDKFQFVYFPETYPNYRDDLKFVLPFRINTPNNQSFSLFAVWTKEDLYTYYRTLKMALETYTFSEPSIFIGDFNTGIKEVSEWEYQRQEKMFNENNFQNCAEKFSKEMMPTFVGKKSLFINDFCYATKDCSVAKFDIDASEKFKNLSDHCPIIVEFGL